MMQVQDEHGVIRISGFQPTGDRHTPLTEMVVVIDKETGAVVVTGCAYLKALHCEVEMHSSRCNALSSVLWLSNCNIVDTNTPFNLVGKGGGE